MNSEQRVVVVDDDPGVLDSLSMLLESVNLPCQPFDSPQAFLDEVDEIEHGCVVLDIRMPGMSGLEVQSELRKRDISLPVIFMTGHGDIEMAVRAMRFGALDFIQKPYSEQDLLDRIHEALARESDHCAAASERDELLDRIDTLSPRERQVFDRVAGGQANKAIAIDLEISERTVEVHRAQVMSKMHARTLADLVRMHLQSQESLSAPLYSTG